MYMHIWMAFLLFVIEVEFILVHAYSVTGKCDTY